MNRSYPAGRSCSDSPAKAATGPAQAAGPCVRSISGEEDSIMLRGGKCDSDGFFAFPESSTGGPGKTNNGSERGKQIRRQWLQCQLGISQ